MPLAFATGRLYAFGMNLKDKNLILLICLIVGLLVFLKLSKKDYAIKTAPPSIKEPRPVAENRPSPTPSTSTSSPVVASGMPVAAAPAISPSPTPAAGTTLTAQVSQQAKLDFEKASFVKMSLPEHLAFRPLDLDMDNTSAIVSRSNGLDMTIVARKGEVSQKEIEGFIKSSDTGVPGLDRRGLFFSAPRSVQPPSNSGLRSAQLWSGVGPQGTEVHIAVFNRADGAGSYMFVVSGKGTALETYGDEFEKIYSSLQATPLPK